MTVGLAVVVPNFNGAQVLPRTLAALAAQTAPPDEVVVVDNGSLDGSAAAAEKDYPGVRVVRVGWNSGFGAAANRGVAETSSPLVAVLNSDARPVSRWVERVTAFAAAAPSSAWCWGGVLVTPGGRVESAGDCWSVNGFSYKHAQGAGLEQLPAEPYEVLAPPGAAPVFRREVFLALGGYDDRYFLYLEDVDLALRARSRGWTSWVLPGAEVEHDLGASGTNAVATWHVARNEVWCQLTHSPQLHPRALWRTTRRELAAARSRGAGGAYVRGRLAAVPALPRLLVARKQERRARAISDEELLRSCELPGALR